MTCLLVLYYMFGGIYRQRNVENKSYSGDLLCNSQRGDGNYDKSVEKMPPFRRLLENNLPKISQTFQDLN